MACLGTTATSDHLMRMVLVEGVPEAAPPRPMAIQCHVLEQLVPVLLTHRAVHLHQQGDAAAQLRRSHGHGSRTSVQHAWHSRLTAAHVAHSSCTADTCARAQLLACARVWLYWRHHATPRPEQVAAHHSGARTLALQFGVLVRCRLDCDALPAALAL